MNKKDFLVSEQIKQDLNKIINRYVERINKSNYYKIEYVFAFKVSNPEEPLGMMNIVMADFHVAESLIDDLNKNNYVFGFDKDSTITDFFESYKENIYE
jgi:prepilin-type processing-associated H-X9-DG protein